VLCVTAAAHGDEINGVEIARRVFHRTDPKQLAGTLVVVPIAAHEADCNRQLAALRAKVEHPFRVIKRQFGFTRVRYRGLAKNTARLHVLFALANLYLARRRLLAAPG
jgi:predicted deacylase